MSLRLPFLCFSQGAIKIAEALKLNRSIANIDLVSEGTLNILNFGFYFERGSLSESGLCLQGGNDIHAEGINAIARVLKDNSIISAVRASLTLIVYF